MHEGKWVSKIILNIEKLIATLQIINDRYVFYPADNLIIKSIITLVIFFDISFLDFHSVKISIMNLLFLSIDYLIMW